jgi:magnesium transporter
MLRSYGPSCDGSLIEAKAEKIPDTATWVDLEEPTREEEQLVERCIHLDVPTESEMAEIEPSSRLYERDGALYMTVSVLVGLQEGEPRTTPMSFVLTDNRLVTVRYATPKPVRAFEEHARRDPSLVKDAPTALFRMIDAIIDRLADELESIAGTIEEISGTIFNRKMDARRIPADRLTALLTKIGRTQILLAKIRYSSVSTTRMLSFLSGANRFHEQDQSDFRHHLTSLSTDVISIGEQASFLSDNLQFLLDASLGLISIEQNAAMKVFSWAAVVFLPPTLIAGIYGMNFHYFPELDWHYGYAISLGMMVASAIGPYLYFKFRGWI